MSCAPTIIHPDLMRQSRLNLPFEELRDNPIPFENRLFVFGAKIAETRLIEEGSLIEAVYILVDDYGIPRNSSYPSKRVRALYPRQYGYLDPLVFEKGRFVTIAGIFKGLKHGKIEELNYVFPYFQIEEIYLWDKVRVYPYFYPRFYDPFYDDQWRYRFGYRYYWLR